MSYALLSGNLLQKKRPTSMLTFEGSQVQGVDAIVEKLKVRW